MSFSFSGCLKQSKKGLCQANDVPHPYAQSKISRPQKQNPLCLICLNSRNFIPQNTQNRQPENQN